MRSILLVLSLVSLVASAEPLSARDTAKVAGSGEWSVGVFNPLKIGLGHGLELSTHPLLIVGSPNAIIRVVHRTVPEGWSITGEYGLSFPSPAFRLAKPLGISGDLVPSCLVTGDDASKASTCEKPGWILVPRAGVVASRGSQNVFTARADVAAGLLLAGNPGRPLDALPALDLRFAPAMTGWRARVGGRYDVALHDRVRLDVELNA